MANKTKLKCLPGDPICSFVIEMKTNKLSGFSVNISSFVPKNMLLTSLINIFDKANAEYKQYSYNGDTVTVSPTASITSEFSIIMKAVISATAPIFNANEGKATITLTNPESDITIDELTVPLPAEVIGKNISKVTYVPAGGAPIDITNYEVVDGTMIIKQQVVIKKI
jgi:hypothetical protein